VLSRRSRRARGLLAIAGMVGVAVGGQAGTGASTRVVERGDTLSRLARSSGLSVAELARANGIADVHRIRAGQRLVVPAAGAPAPASPGEVVVARGQTLSAVARSLGVGVAELAAANGIADADSIRAGRRLVVPGGGPAGAGSGAVPDGLRRRPERLALLPLFDAAARDFGVPPDLFKAMTWQESGWQNDRVSSARALGIGQLMPDTVSFVNGVLLRARLDPNRPEDNIRMSARFLAYLLRQNDGDEARALASYYQGLASVRSRGPLPQTVRYVANVLALREKF
jgi:N-acetylmuramoyl-L-alanine amidase